MLKQGVIEYVEEPTEWCSGLTIAPKANGGIRMCVDLQALNKGVKREIYPLPKVNEIIAQLAEGRYFSKLDANSGFWQVKMKYRQLKQGPLSLLTSCGTPNLAKTLLVASTTEDAV